MKRYQFICTGNFYRSRLAETLLNHWASEKSLPVRATSRGLEVFAARNEGPISPFTQEYLKVLEISLPEPIPFPQQVSERDFTLADRVILMDESEHRPMMEKYFPTWADRVEYWSFPDIQYQTPDDILPGIAKEVQQLLGQILV
ncbi:MAG: low molecular weight phosphatase family protein [Bacteroidota bacterium]